MTRIIAAVRDLIVVAGWTVGAPVVLAAVAGPPIPQHPPSAAVVRAWVEDPLHAGFAAATARTLAWLVWAVCTAAILGCLAGQLRRLPARLRRLIAYLPPPVQGLTATLVGAAAVTTATAPAASAAALPPAPAVDTTARNHGHLLRGGTFIAAGPDGTATAGRTAADTATSDHQMRLATSESRRPACVVRRGDTLFDLAAAYLGDGDRWPEIYALNRGTHFPRVGGTLTDPDVIYPGWTLDLPDDATPSAGHQPPAPRKPPSNPADAAGPGAPDRGPRTAGPAPSAGSTPATSTPATPASIPPASAATPPAGDDGVAEPASTSPATATSGSSGSTGIGSASASASPTPDRSNTIPAPRRTPGGVPLPGGSWMDLGLAVAIVAAVALVWAHRRRRYTRRPPTAQLRVDDPNLAPMPAVVHQLRRRLRHPAPHDPATTEDRTDLANPDEDVPAEGDPVRQERHGAVAGAGTTAPDDAGQDIPTDGDTDGEFAGPPGPDGDHPPRPVLPTLTHPLLDVWPPAGLGLTGPGAAAAARGFLVAALAAGGLDDPQARSHVVLPAATAATLLGAAAVALPRTPRLTVTAGLDDALELLESETLHRTRLVYAQQVDNLAALRTADRFAEPLPPLLLLADPGGRHERARIAALLAQGQRLDIHGVLLGGWPAGDTVTVAADGTTTPGDAGRHGHHLADLGRLTVLDPDQTSDLIGTLAESHTGQPQPSAKTEPAAAPAPAAPADPPAQSTTPAASPPAPPVRESAAEPADRQAPEGTREEAAAVGDATARTHIQTSAPAGELTDRGVPPSIDDTDAGPATPVTPPGRIGVTVLGRPTIIGADPQRSVRAKSLELLVYLAVHDGTAAAETILDDLLPDAPASKALHRLHTYVSDLRAVLRATAGPGNYLTHTGQRYTLNNDALDIDLWRLRAALRQAQSAGTAADRAAALRRAVDAYAGSLADGCDYEWVEPYREGVRQQVLDAALALADLLGGRPADQLTVLETAIGHNPHAEPLYQTAMRAHAALGQRDAIRTVRRTLTRRLAEIDAEPSDDSLALADRLVADLQRPRPHGGPGTGDGAAG
jgi:DNA-binding SARP family transcriptional activator